MPKRPTTGPALPSSPSAAPAPSCSSNTALLITPRHRALSRFCAFVDAAPSAWGASHFPFLRQTATHPFQWCAVNVYQLDLQNKTKSPDLDHLPIFCGVNTPTISNFKLPTTSLNVSWEEIAQLVSQLQHTTDLRSPAGSLALSPSGLS